MPIYATKESQDFWKACNARSRSLAASKFVHIADSQKDTEWRKENCTAIQNGKSFNEKAKSYSAFISNLVETQGAAVIFGKLEARMIIDSGNGVFENGGICLDRTSGIPFIPGSAIKGAARRYAIWKLGETTDLDEKAKLLATISFTFGYGDQEWKAGRSGKKNTSNSDFWLAMHPISEPSDQHDDLRDKSWSIVSDKAATIILDQLGRTINPDKAPHKQLPNLAGTVCFLPSYPKRDPGIDIDILTCHHGEYYAGKKKVATDDEAPNPVTFPTIAKGASFTFCIYPNQKNEHIEFAKNCLIEAIQLFGIGAKTSAGYGWFSPDSEKEEEFKNKQIIKKLDFKYSGFTTWNNDKKDEAILELSDQTENCKLWNEINPEQFDPIATYAKNQGIELL